MDNERIAEVVDTVKDLAEKAAEEVRDMADKIVEEIEESNLPDDKVEDLDEEVVESEVLDEAEGDESENESAKTKTEKTEDKHLSTGKKVAIVAGVGAVAICAGVVFRRNTMKTAYHIARAMI